MTTQYIFLAIGYCVLFGLFILSWITKRIDDGTFLGRLGVGAMISVSAGIFPGIGLGFFIGGLWLAASRLIDHNRTMPIEYFIVDQKSTLIFLILLGPLIISAALFWFVFKHGPELDQARRESNEKES